MKNKRKKAKEKNASKTGKAKGCPYQTQKFKQF